MIWDNKSCVGVALGCGAVVKLYDEFVFREGERFDVWDVVEKDAV